MVTELHHHLLMHCIAAQCTPYPSLVDDLALASLFLVLRVNVHGGVTLSTRSALYGDKERLRAVAGWGGGREGLGSETN